jgi:DNA-binding transcriptional LysR family regulator
MLDAIRLQVFVHVAAAGSIANAAKALGYTPSAVSQQLSKLEREVGAVLAMRTRGGVELTTEGRVLMDHAGDLLSRLAAAEQAVRDAAQLRASEVRLGSFASGSLMLLAPTIAVFRREHPAVRLSLRDVEPPAGYDDVRRGDLDLLVTHAYPGVTPPEPDGLIAEELLHDPLVAVVPEHWLPRSQQGPLSPGQLAEISLISGGPGDANRTALDTALASAGTSPRVEFEIKDYAITLALVAAGAGAAVVPRLIASRAGNGVRVLPIDPAQERRIFALHRLSSGNAAVTLFMTYLREVTARSVPGPGQLLPRGSREPLGTISRADHPVARSLRGAALWGRTPTAPHGACR